MKILVVDDEGIVLESCRKVLTAGGFEVFSAQSADEALTAMEKGQYTLLLVDLKMPIHDGVYLLRELKNRQCETPTIVMSGYSTRETMREAEVMGALRFLEKPFTLFCQSPNPDSSGLNASSPDGESTRA